MQYIRVPWLKYINLFTSFVSEFRRLDKIQGKNTNEMYLAVFSIGSCLFLSTCYILVHPVSPVPVSSLSYAHRSIHGLPVARRAFSIIAPSGGEDLDTVHGEIFLEETNEGVFITGTIHGLKPGRHGFHVHQEGDLGNSCKASGGHYNPAGVSSFHLQYS